MKLDIVEKGAVIQRDRKTYAITPNIPANAGIQRLPWVLDPRIREDDG